MLFQGGQKRIIEIENAVFTLLGDTNLEVEEATEKTNLEQNSSSDSSGEIQDKRTENLWNAVEEIKAQLSLLVPSFSVNPPNDPKIIIEGKKENNHLTEKNNCHKSVSNVHLAKKPSKRKALKQKTVTEFFKPITDKHYHSINELNVLHITIS